MTNITLHTNSLSAFSADSTPALALDTSAAAPNSANNGDTAYRAKATEAAIRFEGTFIANMLHQMRAASRELADKDSVFKDPVNSDMLDMADTMMADKIAGQRAFGVADAILRQLLPNNTAGSVTQVDPAAITPAAK